MSSIVSSDREIRNLFVGRRGNCSTCHREFSLEELSRHDQELFPKRTFNVPNLCDECFDKIESTENLFGLN
ncbi:MAG: hypothetical protein ACTSRK_20670 [Promethearchaeota archaeon]